MTVPGPEASLKMTHIRTKILHISIVPHSIPAASLRKAQEAQEAKAPPGNASEADAPSVRASGGRME